VGSGGDKKKIWEVVWEAGSYHPLVPTSPPLPALPLGNTIHVYVLCNCNGL